jgi:hypothetical protein
MEGAIAKLHRRVEDLEMDSKRSRTTAEVVLHRVAILGDRDLEELLRGLEANIGRIGGIAQGVRTEIDRRSKASKEEAAEATDERLAEDTNEINPTKEHRLPPRLREIFALATRLRVLLADADAGNHVPIREVFEVEDGFDVKKLDQPELRRVMDRDWYDMFVVVVTRFGEMLRLGVGGGILGLQFFEGPEGDIETRWMGDGEALTQARRMLRVAETLVGDYHATFR